MSSCFSCNEETKACSLITIDPRQLKSSKKISITVQKDTRLSLNSCCLSHRPLCLHGSELRVQTANS